MQFLMYTMGDDSVPPPPPSPELMIEMGKFVEEATKAGALLATGGLAPSAEATKVSYVDGKFTVVDGPFAEAKELIGGWALMSYGTRTRRSSGPGGSCASSAAARRRSARRSAPAT